MCGIREEGENGEGSDGGGEVGEGWKEKSWGVILSILAIREILFTHA